MTKKEVLGVIARVAVAAGLFIAAILNYDRLKNIDIPALARSLQGSVTMIVIVVLALYVVKGLILILPASIMYIGVGLILPIVQATALNLGGIALELTAGYLLGRFLGGEYVNRLLMKTKGGRKVLEKNIQDRIAGIFLVRLVPVPIDLVSLVYGASKSRFAPYLIFSLLGIAPRVILFTLVGDKFFDYIPMHMFLKGAIILLPVGIVAYVVYKIVSVRKKNRQMSADLTDS